MVVAKGSIYEENRQKRLEENKKRIQELKDLAQSLRPNSCSMKKVTPKVPKEPLDPASIRKSGRVAEKPTVSYKNVPVFAVEVVKKHKKKKRCAPKISKLLERVYASDKNRAYAIKRAEKLQSSLNQDFPSFVKPMTQSHVTGGFWLGLPKSFCLANYFSNYQSEFTITLVDEQGDESSTKYLPLKHGLSAGWRGFSIKHGLVDGDALVFQLIAPKTFKVYIIRANRKLTKK